MSFFQWISLVVKVVAFVANLSTIVSSWDAVVRQVRRVVPFLFVLFLYVLFLPLLVVVVLVSRVIMVFRD